MKLLYIILAFFTLNSYAQNVKELEALSHIALDFGPEVQKDWQRKEKLLSTTTNWKNLTQEELDLIEKYGGEAVASMWDILGGCSFYCGAGNYEVSASSELEAQGSTKYLTANIYDFSYETAWVEGVKGYGIGEYIEFDIAATHPRITQVIIVNGYVKNKKTWQNNSRVKQLKMYINDEPYAILHLKDIYASQIINIEPLGYSEREDVNKLKEMKNHKVKFEILEVYKGDKYDDTAITEIYFDGIDVH